jgi:methylmalonyl-CoA mutase C-terminal domain/subunit
MAKDKDTIKVLVAKTSLDGHWRGVAMVTTALRNAGMEVVYGGMITPDQIVDIALQEDVDVIGLNIGGRHSGVESMFGLMREKGMDKILVVAGGVVPPEDIPVLKEMGVAGVFPPGSRLEDIVSFIREKVTARPSA